MVQGTLHAAKPDMFLENSYHDIRGPKSIEMLLAAFGACILEVLRGKAANICLILESSKAPLGTPLRLDHIESC